MEASVEELKSKFQNKNLDSYFGPTILEKMSSKNDQGKVFPPYIPFLGKNFEKYKILVYCTAQNMAHNGGMRSAYSNNLSALSERLYYSSNFKLRYGDDKFSVSNVPIAPFQQFVIPSLIAVYIKALRNDDINPDEILDYSGVTNYYKFSLNHGSRDLNPDGDMSCIPEGERYRYWALNDLLVKEELSIIKPEAVLCFGGQKLRVLASLSGELRYNLLAVNDPSWILRGGAGVLKSGTWREEYDALKSDVKNFIDSYACKLTGSYESKKNEVKAYLAHYYNIFVSSCH